jgi:hypothetical protein
VAVSRYVKLAILLLAFATPALADGEPAAAPSPYIAAAWCEVYNDERPVDNDVAVGCDVGVGVALYRYDRLAAVAAIGTKTIGVGLAWVVPNVERPIAISLGAIAPYDKRGVDVGGWAIAVGATFGFGGRD